MSPSRGLGDVYKRQPITPLNKRVIIDFKSFKTLILINVGRKIRNAIIFFTKLMSMDL